MVYSIQQRASECLYSRVVPGESVTFSVFITSGAALKGTAYFEGPVAPPEVESGVELTKAIRLYDKGQRYPNPASTIYKEALVDFETDNWDDDDNMFEDDDDYDDDDYLDDDEVNVASRDTASADQRRKQRVQRVEARRRKYEEQKRRKIRRHQRANEGDAQQMTFDPPAPGWYRGCMKGSWYQITAEMEMRLSSELGGVDPETGHVMSYERRRMLDEEKAMMVSETIDGLKDEDMKTTQEQVRKLNRLLNEIKEMQQQERHRLSIHTATNEHSHSRMVLNSLLETVLFMAVTGFQVYTIRKWFSGAPVLGR